MAKLDVYSVIILNRNL